MTLNSKNKLTISLSILVVIIIVFSSFILYARRVTTHSYQGTDGKWYWVEFHVDAKYGTEYSKVWIHGEGGPYIINGHETPEKPSSKTWWWPFSVSPGGGEPTDPTWPGTANIPVTPDMLANTHLTTIEGGVKITTDKSIKIKVTDLTTGMDMSDLIPVANEYTFNTSNLPVGCRYAVLVYQNFNEVEGDILINTHNFCK